MNSGYDTEYFTYILIGLGLIALYFLVCFPFIFVCISYLSFERKRFFLNGLNLFGFGMLSKDETRPLKSRVQQGTVWPI